MTLRTISGSNTPRRFGPRTIFGGSVEDPFAPLAVSVVRPIANRTKSTYINTHLSDGINTFGVFRSRHRIFPGWDCTGGFRAWYCNRSADTNGQNAIIVSAEYEYPAGSANWVSLTWGGLTSITIQVADPDQGTDAISVTMAGGSYLRIRSHVNVAIVGQKWPVLDSLSLAAANTEGYALSVISDPGDPPNADFAEFYGPTAITGLSKAPFAVGIFSDSIGNGAKDTLTGDTIGFLQRILGGTIPVINFSTSGDTLAGFVTTNTRRLGLADQCGLTTGIIAYGTNDAQTLSTLKTNYRIAIGLMNVRGLSTVCLPVLASTTSTDSWATALNQISVTGYTVGGIFDQFNTWIQTQVGTGGVDKFVDTRIAWQDVVNKIQTTGAAFGNTPDGLHPNPAGNVLIATAFTPLTTIPVTSKVVQQLFLSWDTLVTVYDPTSNGAISAVTTEPNKVLGNGDLTPGAGTTTATARAATAVFNSPGLLFNRTGASNTSVLTASSTSVGSQMIQGTNLNYTVLMVVVPTASAVGFVCGWSAPISGTVTAQAMLVYRSALAATWRYGQTGDVNLDVTLPTLNPNQMYVIAIQHKLGATTAWVNSLTPFVSTAAQAPTNAFPSTTQITLGDSVLQGVTPAFNTSGYGGSIFEFAAASSARSSAEIQQAITDLANRFGVTLT